MDHRRSGPGDRVHHGTGTRRKVSSCLASHGTPSDGQYTKLASFWGFVPTNAHVSTNGIVPGWAASRKRCGWRKIAITMTDPGDELLKRPLADSDVLPLRRWR